MNKLIKSSLFNIYEKTFRIYSSNETSSTVIKEIRKELSSLIGLQEITLYNMQNRHSLSGDEIDYIISLVKKDIDEKDASLNAENKNKTKIQF